MSSLWPPVDAVDAVLLLEDVGQLRAAVAEHVRVLRQHVGNAGEAGMELVLDADPPVGSAAACGFHQMPPNSLTKWGWPS